MLSLVASAAGSVRSLLVARGYTPDSSPPPKESIDVGVGLALNQARSLDLMSGVVAIEVWLTLSWTDPRLAWSSDAFNGTHETSLPTSAAWLPELELLNGFESSIATALPTGKSFLVQSDGACSWSRAGTLQATCGLSGLQNFPFDSIACAVRFGAWTDRSLNLTIGSMASPWPVGAVSSTWREYRLSSTASSRSLETRSCCDGTWPVITFDIELERASRFYAHKVVAINMLLTFLSFGVFFTHPLAINRQHFSITVLLTQTTADGFIYGSLPRAPHFLWIEYFMLISWIFCFLTNIENFVMLFVHWKSDPAWSLGGTRDFNHCAEYRHLKALTRRLLRRGVEPGPYDAAIGAGSDDKWLVARLPDKRNTASPESNTITACDAASDGRSTSDCSASASMERRASRASKSDPSMERRTSRDLDSPMQRRASQGSCSDFEGKQRSRKLSVSLERRTSTLDPVQATLVRQAFRQLDPGRTSLLGPEELMIFTDHMGHFDFHTDLRMRRVLDGSHWTIEDFSQLCLAAIDKHGQNKFEILLKGLIETQKDRQLEGKFSWQRAALRVDIMCQRILPAVYALCIAVLFAIRLPDPA